MYYLEITPEAEIDLRNLSKSSPKEYEKAKKLIEEIVEHPRTGTGHPERLKHFKNEEYWSRTISKKNRLVYQIEDEVILITLLSAKGHYNDK